MYKDFLQLSAGAADEVEDKPEDHLEEFPTDNQEVPKAIEEEESIDDHGLKEELTQIMNENETSYHDLKYWKTNNYYDIESLLRSY